MIVPLVSPFYSLSEKESISDLCARCRKAPVDIVTDRGKREKKEKRREEGERGSRGESRLRSVLSSQGRVMVDQIERGNTFHLRG